MMDHRVARSEFKRGLTLLRGRRPELALPHIRQAVVLKENDPHYLSYFGVAIALAKQRWATAELYCQRALRMKRDEARLHLNLAEVYLSAGRRHDAVETLKRGLQCVRRPSLLIRALSRIVLRRRPLLPFLDRKHFLNYYSGMVRHHFLSFLAQL